MKCGRVLTSVVEVVGVMNAARTGGRVCGRTTRTPLGRIRLHLITEMGVRDAFVYY